MSSSWTSTVILVVGESAAMVRSRPMTIPARRAGLAQRGSADVRRATGDIQPTATACRQSPEICALGTLPSGPLTLEPTPSAIARQLQRWVAECRGKCLA